MTSQAPTIDILLNLVPDNPDSVLSHLTSHPELASKQDRHGYSLVHAATSYDQLDLLKKLIQEYNVDPNIIDEDGETCLFNAESVEFARELIDLGVNIELRNNDGHTAAEKLNDEDEQPQVAAFLREGESRGSGANTTANGIAIDSRSANTTNGPVVNGNVEEVRPIPPQPDGISVSIGTMSPEEVGGEPDPEFRSRIEELAARQDFEGEESQRELRDLIADAVSGFNNQGQGSATRRRLG